MPAYSQKSAAIPQPPAATRSGCSAVPGLKPRSPTLCCPERRGTAHVPTNPGDGCEVPDSAAGEWSRSRSSPAGAYASGKIGDDGAQSAQILRMSRVFGIQQRLDQRGTDNDQIGEIGHLARLLTVGYA